jgi:undecaprenyl-diphosphatase
VAAAQLLAAAFPGTSRSGAAIMASLILGLSRPAAVRFAFMVGIPTMFAAGGKEILEALKAGQGAELAAPGTLIAFVVATVSAFLAVKWLLKFVQTRDFLPFAWYRLAMGAALFLAVLTGWKA